MPKFLNILIAVPRTSLKESKIGFYLCSDHLEYKHQFVGLGDWFFSIHENKNYFINKRHNGQIRKLFVFGYQPRFKKAGTHSKGCLLTC